MAGVASRHTAQVVTRSIVPGANKEKQLGNGNTNDINGALVVAQPAAFHEPPLFFDRDDWSSHDGNAINAAFDNGNTRAGAYLRKTRILMETGKARVGVDTKNQNRNLSRKFQTAKSSISDFVQRQVTKEWLAAVVAPQRTDQCQDAIRASQDANSSTNGTPQDNADADGARPLTREAVEALPSKPTRSLTREAIDVWPQLVESPSVYETISLTSSSIVTAERKPTFDATTVQQPTFDATTVQSESSNNNTTVQSESEQSSGKPHFCVGAGKFVKVDEAAKAFLSTSVGSQLFLPHAMGIEHYFAHKTPATNLNLPIPESPEMPNATSVLLNGLRRQEPGSPAVSVSAASSQSECSDDCPEAGSESDSVVTEDSMEILEPVSSPQANQKAKQMGATDQRRSMTKSEQQNSDRVPGVPYVNRGLMFSPLSPANSSATERSSEMAKSVRTWKDLPASPSSDGDADSKISATAAHSDGDSDSEPEQQLRVMVENEQPSWGYDPMTSEWVKL